MSSYDIDELIKHLEKIIQNEKEEERRRASKEHDLCRVIDISRNAATLTVDCTHSRFEEGDVVGYKLKPKDPIKPLGTVIVGGQMATIGLLERTKDDPDILNLDINDEIEIYEAEVLIGYDLQLGLLSSIKERKLSERENRAVEALLKKLPMPRIRKITLKDKSCVDGSCNLDEYQAEAVESILGLDDGELLLIIGPPGTGKTKVIAKAADELSKRCERVLITSHTNRAVDNAIEQLPVDRSLRVGRPEKVLERVRPYLLSYKARTALGKRLIDLEKKINDLRRRIYRSLKHHRARKLHTPEDLKRLKELGRLQTPDLKRLYEELKKAIEERNSMLIDESKRLVKGSKIVGSTLIKSQLDPLDTEEFDVVLIDESSQASITLALLGMVKARRWVLIGDHKQLLPIFKTVNDREMQERLSAFNSALKNYKDRALWLRRHYRSNIDIIGFPQRYIYEGEISPADICKYIKLELREKPLPGMEFLGPAKPVLFVGVCGHEKNEGGSKYNENEIEVIKEIVSLLEKLGVSGEQIGVITPFRAQKRKIVEALKEHRDIEINTVDAFQGREKDVIIFSVTSTSNMKFVEDPNRLNVAITRAKRKLIVIGNPRPIMQFKGLLSKFIEYAGEREGLYVREERKYREVKLDELIRAC